MRSNTSDLSAVIAACDKAAFHFRRADRHFQRVAWRLR